MTPEEYNIASTNEKYDFTACPPQPKRRREKERDTETGLNYFGARYYDSDLGRWISVDPFAYKRPGLSPYQYVQNNPLRRVDPNGMLDEETEEKKKEKEQIVQQENQNASDNDAGTLVTLSLSFSASNVVGLNTEYGVIINLDNSTMTPYLTRGFSFGIGASALFEFATYPNESVNGFLGKSGSMNNAIEIEGGTSNMGINMSLSSFPYANSQPSISGFGFAVGASVPGVNLNFNNYHSKGKSINYKMKDYTEYLINASGKL